MLVNEDRMYRRWMPVALGIVLLLFTACQRENAEGAKNLKSQSAAMRATGIRVEGMVCVACAARVKELLKTTPGVDLVELNLEEHVVHVQYDPDKTNPERLAIAVNQLGYKASVLQSDSAPSDK
jgi:copper chaperone CopZ